MKFYERVLAAAQAGNIQAALAILQSKPITQASKAMRQAGFKVCSEENKRDFWEEVRGSLMDASSSSTRKRGRHA